MATIEDFMKLDLRVAKIVEAENHPDADRLFVLKVDLGEEEPRQLVAGIRSGYVADELVGKKVVVIANVESATIRGQVSQGMVLAASDENSISVLSPEKDIAIGSRVK